MVFNLNAMIHAYSLNNFNIVLDTDSNSIHIVDEVIFDIVKILDEKFLASGRVATEISEQLKQEISIQIKQKYPDLEESDLNDCFDDINELISAGKLFTIDNFKPNLAQLSLRKTSIKALCLHIAHTCNLNCEYCFASEGKYKKNSDENLLMTFEMGKKALDFLVANSAGRHNLEVDFFGGEPLVNFGVVVQLVEYARSIEKDVDKHFRFTLTTNGVLIDDDVIDFANREMDNVVLSLDGRKEVHDHFRKTLAGKGSYDTIVPKFQKMVEARGDKEYYIRGTYTHNNPDFMKDILHMLDLGFSELSMEPVVCDPSDQYALTESDKDIIFEQYELLAREMIERKQNNKPFTFYHYMLDLESGPCIYKRIAGCGSGTEYLCVTPKGELYPCHQFVGKKDFLMGTLDTGVTNHDKVKEFGSCNVYSKPECEECWARLFCSGGCAANNFNQTGDINKVYTYGCDLFKKRLECAIMVKVAEQMND